MYRSTKCKFSVMLQPRIVDYIDGLLAYFTSMYAELLLSNISNLQTVHINLICKLSQYTVQNTLQLEFNVPRSAFNAGAMIFVLHIYQNLCRETAD